MYVVHRCTQNLYFRTFRNSHGSSSNLMESGFIRYKLVNRCRNLGKKTYA